MNNFVFVFLDLFCQKCKFVIRIGILFWKSKMPKKIFFSIFLFCKNYCFFYLRSYHLGNQSVQNYAINTYHMKFCCVSSWWYVRHPDITTPLRYCSGCWRRSRRLHYSWRMSGWFHFDISLVLIKVWLWPDDFHN